MTGDGVFGTFFSINIGFGLAVAMGVHIGGTVSGKRIDPLNNVKGFGDRMQAT